MFGECRSTQERWVKTCDHVQIKFGCLACIARAYREDWWVCECGIKRELDVKRCAFCERRRPPRFAGGYQYGLVPKSLYGELVAGGYIPPRGVSDG